LYLYAVLQADTPAHRLLGEGGIAGLEPGQPLFAIVADGLVAAVSRVPAATFEEQALNELVADMARLAPLAVGYEEAVGTLARVAPAVVPMHFGAVYRGPEGVEALLRARRGALRDLLQRLHGTQEWGLQLFAEPEDLERWVAQESAALREADAAISRDRKS